MEMSLHDRDSQGRTPIGRGRQAEKAAAERRLALKSDRREVNRLCGLWEDIALAGTLPSLDILPQFLGADGWDRRFLVAQDPDPLSSVFITCGAVIDEMLGADVKGRTLREITWAGCQPLFDGCIQSAQSRQPTAISCIIRSFSNLEFPVRGVILPFGSGRDCIPYLLGAIGRRSAEQSS